MDRPILFSAPMIRALLREVDPKTQTRRIVKPQPEQGLAVGSYRSAGEPAEFVLTEEGDPIDAAPLRCPYGVPGDRLWVRESLRRAKWEDADDAIAYAADGEFAWDMTRPAQWGWQRATLPSIHCPRGLSRITLEVTGVRVERLQAISEADAKAEGVEALQVKRGMFATEPSFRGAFKLLWDTINGERAGWASNPWVWVIEFKRVQPA